MFHELVELPHVIAREMCRLRRFVAPAFGDPDQPGDAGVFGQAVLQAAIKHLHLRCVQNDPSPILDEILWQDFHETLDDNHAD